MGLLAALLDVFGRGRARGLSLPATRSFPREIVGESAFQAELAALCGGYSRDGVDVRCVALLTPEPDNPHDANAVRVTIKGRPVGYLTRTDAARFVSQLNKAGYAGRSVAASARISGGWRRNQHDQGHFGVRLGFTWPLKLPPKSV